MTLVTEARLAVRYLGWAAIAGSVACGSEALDGNERPARDGQGEVLEVPVSANTRSFVGLSTGVVHEQAPGVFEWDLAFEGYGVFTNGGASGPGAGSAFGPLSAPTFLSDTAPNVPFLTHDEPGGAFLRWYAYDGSDHRLFSRFHRYGLRDEERHYKVQILGYYAEEQGAPVSQRYRLRYAEVLPSGSSDVQEVSGLDASDGSTAETASECIDLASGERLRLTLDQARESEDWHLCFRRDSISVNGGSGGPRGVEAVDLDASNTATESMAEVRSRTVDSELAGFDAVDWTALEAQTSNFRADGILSAFSGRWLLQDADPPAPTQDVWLVIGATGAQKFLIGFDGFDAATPEAPGRIRLRVKSVL